jgi:hypothetical protein
VDCSISQQKQNIVGLLTLLLHAVVLESSQDATEVSWSTQRDLRKRASVSLEDTGDALDHWVVSSDWEAMACLLHLHVAGNTTETEQWEHLIGIVVLKDTTNLHDSGLILVVWSHSVQALWRPRVSIRTSVVDSDTLADLPATPYPISEESALWLHLLLLLLMHGC